MSIRDTLEKIKIKIKICYQRVHFTLKLFFVFLPLTISILSFLYTLFGQSREEFTFWENIFVSLLWGYGTAIVIFLIGIPFQLLSTVSNKSININNVRAADPEQLIESFTVIELFLYCIVFVVLKGLSIFVK